MAARMKVLGVKGVVVSGRVRDLGELKESGLQVCMLPIMSPKLLNGVSLRYGPVELRL